MSITADPLFIAAEVQWRRDNLSRGLDTVVAARHHGAGLRAALKRLGAGRHGTGDRGGRPGNEHPRRRDPRQGLPRTPRPA
ncbi:hypothetical protein [Pedococcus sp. 5OH_020]|uniref:hypothetical protein n=1 Tax=Pedococcus sp. 5OH_020 TaxID=2989814 RepID=UPI0022E9C911|nr:hypothetical protein [Pedococcus sp. 5OH_020]